MKTINNTPPTLHNAMTNTRAWRVDLQEWRAGRAAAGQSNPDDAAVAIWIVNAPWSHPIWPNVLIYAVHLRPREGGAPPIVRLAGATHEIGVIALEPDEPVTLDGSTSFRHLTPDNFVGQWIADSDEAAAARIEATVQEIVAGQLNPDTDGMRQWIARFGNHCFKQEFRDAQPGTLAHAIGQGSTVIIPDGAPAAIVITPATADDKPPEAPLQ